MRLLRVSAWSALRPLLPLRTEPASVKPSFFLSRLLIREEQVASAARDKVSNRTISIYWRAIGGRNST